MILILMQCRCGYSDHNNNGINLIILVISKHDLLTMCGKERQAILTICVLCIFVTTLVHSQTNALYFIYITTHEQLKKFRTN